MTDAWSNIVAASESSSKGKPRFGKRVKKKKVKSMQAYRKEQRKQTTEKCGICLNSVAEAKVEAKDNADQREKVRLVEFPSCQCHCLMCQGCLQAVITKDKPSCPGCRAPLRCANCDKVIAKGWELYKCFKHKGRIAYYVCSSACESKIKV